MKAKVSATISRSSDNLINIRFQDCSSRIRFLEASFTLEKFSLLITGLAEIETDAKLTRLEHVGKIKVREDRQTLCPIMYDRNLQQKWLEENRQEEGWYLDAYLGSQGSVDHVNNQARLHYHVFKYIEPPCPDCEGKGCVECDGPDHRSA